jgi:hypothetical protein
MSASITLQQNPGRHEAFDLIGNDRGLPRRDPLKQIAVRNERQTLPPRPIARREARRHIVARTEIRQHAVQQFLLHGFPLAERAPGERGLMVQDLAPHDLMDPGFVHVQRAQLIGDRDRVAARAARRQRMSRVPKPVERSNLSIRMGNRRSTILTNEFSKQAANHEYAMATQFMHYNFVRIHLTVRCAPAMTARVNTKLRELSDMVKVLGDRERMTER